MSRSLLRVCLTRGFRHYAGMPSAGHGCYAPQRVTSERSATMPTITRNERVYGTDAMFVAGIRIGVDGRGSWDSAWGWDSVRATALPKRPVGTTAWGPTAGQPAP